MMLSVVVPCYNEEENIPLILERFSEVIGRRSIEVILVNNGSTDHSARVLEQLLPAYPFARSTLVPVNRGYGYGILQGLKEAKGEYLGWTHADMQTDPKDVVTAYEMLIDAEGKDIFLKGNRKGRPLFDTFFTAGMSLFETLYFRMPMHDINAQPNIFSRKFYESWREPPYDFALDLYAVYMACRQGIRICRFPVTFPERIHGQSKWNTGLKAKWKFIKRTITFSHKLKHQGIF